MLALATVLLPRKIIFDFEESLSLKVGRHYIIKRITPTEAKIYDRLNRNEGHIALLPLSILRSETSALYALFPFFPLGYSHDSTNLDAACRSGTLVNYVKEGSLRDEDKVLIITKLRAGLNHLHNLGIFHYDLHPKNILLTETGKVPYLIDFGLTYYLPANSDYSTMQRCPTYGTVGYSHPEFLLNKGLTTLANDRATWCSTLQKADNWALGLTIVYLLGGGSFIPEIDSPTILLRWYQHKWNIQKVICNLNVPERHLGHLLKTLTMCQTMLQDDAELFDRHRGE